MKLTRFSGTGIHGFLKFDVNFYDDLTFLYGINGSGKTTVLNSIVALITPSLHILAELEFREIRVEVENEGRRENAAKSSISRRCSKC
jgi:predicted ATP-binding protein involved in virulence